MPAEQLNVVHSATTPRVSQWHGVNRVHAGGRIRPWHWQAIGWLLLGVTLLAYFQGFEYAWVFSLLDIFLIPICYALRYLSRDQVDAHDKDLMAGLGQMPCVLCDWGICINGYIVGRDRGVIWLENGLMYFNGHRSSFALSKAMLGPLRARTLIAIWKWGMYKNEVSLKGFPGLRISVVLRPIVEQNTNLKQSVRLVKLNGAVEIGQYPPVELGPDRLSLIEGLITQVSQALCLLPVGYVLANILAIIWQKLGGISLDLNSEHFWICLLVSWILTGILGPIYGFARYRICKARWRGHTRANCST